MSAALRRSTLDGRQRSKRAVMARLARDLGVGEVTNLDALWDVLRTDIAGPLEIVWRPTAAVRTALGTDFERLRRLLRDLAHARADVTLVIEPV